MQHFIVQSIAVGISLRLQHQLIQLIDREFALCALLEDILLEAEEKMMKTEEVVLHEFAGVRTGKASPGLVENIQVEVYGSQMRIRELAGITTPEPRR